MPRSRGRPILAAASSATVPFAALLAVSLVVVNFLCFPVAEGFRPASADLSRTTTTTTTTAAAAFPFNRRQSTSSSAISVPFRLSTSDDSYGSEDYTAGAAAEYIPIEEFDDGFTCDPDFPCVEDTGAFAKNIDMGYVLLVGIPAIAPFVAFATYGLCANAFHGVADYFAANNWVAVDGGDLQSKTLAPLINGLVVPAVALLFATLTSTTITTLRKRQVDVRKAINMEAGELRAIECLLDAIEPGPVQDSCRDYLIQYTSRILAECHPRMGSGDDVINPRRSFDSELNGFTRHLNEGHGGCIPGHVAEECYASVARLREQRSYRISALQSVYPPLHYGILLALAIAELVAFLMETNQELLVFLNAFQLKVLWSMMVGTFVACFAVFIDMRAPFSGSYQISASVDQLHTIKLTLQASRHLASSNKEESKSDEYSEIYKKANGVSKPAAYDGWM